MAEPAESRTTLGRVQQAVVITVAAASVGLAVLLTQTAWFRTHGSWHLPAVKAAIPLLAAAVLLFALGVEWALRRRALVALVALAPLPAWILALHATRMETPVGGGDAVLANANLLVNDVWLGLIMMQMQGVQPFGGG